MVVWIYSLAWVAIKGIHYVGQVAKILNWVPLIMILIVFWANKSGISSYQPLHHDPVAGFWNVITIVIGFFATAGAAGADFGMNNRNRKDIVLGGVFGIIGGVLVAGGLPILSVAGYLGRKAGPPSYNYTARYFQRWYPGAYRLLSLCRSLPGANLLFIFYRFE